MATWYDSAKKELGVEEWPDPKENPHIVEYLKTVGQPGDDEIPWCSAFVNWCMGQAGIKGTGKANARSWLEWGIVVPPEQAREGDVVIMWRDFKDSWQGHVGFWAGAVGNHVLVLGGNQRNQVNVKSFPSDRILGVRRPK